MAKIRKFSVPALFSIALLSPASSQETVPNLPSGTIETEWVAIAGTAGERSHTLEKWGIVDLSTIRPKRLFRIEERLVDARGKKLNKRSMYFASVADHSNTFCEPLRAIRSKNVICLVDADGDGQAERFFRVQPNAEIFDRGEVGDFEMLQQPVALSSIEASDAKMELPLQISFSGRKGDAQKTAQRSIKICYKRWVPALLMSGSFVGSCTPPLRFDKGSFPQSIDMFGRKITLNAVNKKTVDITITVPEGDVAF